jgi:oligoendopeptidase F
MTRRLMFATVFCVVLASFLPDLFAVERSQINSRYQWKPEHIFATLADWQGAVAHVRAGLDSLAAFSGSFAGEKATDPAQKLIAFNALNERMSILLERVEAYCSYHFHVDMSNPNWAGRDQQVQDLFVLQQEKLAWLQPELLRIPRATLMGWVDQYPVLQPYRKTYEDMYLLQAHVLSEPEEHILALAGNITGSAADIFGKLTNVDMRWGRIVDEKGDSVDVTDEGWTGWRYYPDRHVRQAYFHALFGGYRDYQNTLAALMAANLKKNVFLARSRKFDNTLQAALNSVFVPEQVYINLVNTTCTHADPFHKYEAVRKRVLGFDTCYHWDYYVSLVTENEPRYTWEQAVAMVEDALKPLGRQYVADITRGLDTRSGWVDVFANDNKRGGAYSSSTYGVHPYMLFNFDYARGLTMEDVSTVAHEVGHSMHTLYSEKNQPFPNHEYAYFNAEVASTTNEAILAMKLLDDARAAYRKAKGEAKEAAKRHLIYLLDQNLSAARGSFTRQTIFAAWEWEANQMAERGEALTSESLSKLYSDLLTEYYGTATSYGDLSWHEWSRIPHFYRDYYVYTYATSYAAAVSLAKDIRAEAAGDVSKKGATARYLNYLKSGSNKHPVELLKDAGVDMTTPAPILSCMDYMASLVDELDQLTR